MPAFKQMGAVNSLECGPDAAFQSAVESAHTKGSTALVIHSETLKLKVARSIRSLPLSVLQKKTPANIPPEAFISFPVC
jgi:hypothetical protein